MTTRNAILLYCDEQVQFNRYRGRYGAPRIYLELIDQYGCDGNLARVKRLMHQAGSRKFYEQQDLNQNNSVKQLTKA